MTPSYRVDARHPDHGNNWDSDYVSNEPMTLAEANETMSMLRQCATTGEPDPNGETWDGWEFRVGCNDA